MAPFWLQHDGLVIGCTGRSGFLLGLLPVPILNLRLLKPLARSCQRTPLSHAPFWRAVVKIALTLSRLKIFCSSERNTCCGLVFSTTRMVKRVSHVSVHKRLANYLACLRIGLVGDMVRLSWF
jgi:hypothetical protein